MYKPVIFEINPLMPKIFTSLHFSKKNICKVRAGDLLYSDHSDGTNFVTF